MIPDDEDSCDDGTPHDWRWIKDWYGDPDVPNGTIDCSGWTCEKCGAMKDGPKPDIDHSELFEMP